MKKFISVICLLFSASAVCQNSPSLQLDDKLPNISMPQFRDIDINNDNQISKEEFERFQHDRHFRIKQLNQGGTHYKPKRPSFEQLDFDSNQVIDEHEFTQHQINQRAVKRAKQNINLN